MEETEAKSSRILFLSDSAFSTGFAFSLHSSGLAPGKFMCNFELLEKSGIGRGLFFEYVLIRQSFCLSANLRFFVGICVRKV
jgi:hypothetical protein